MGQVSPLTLFHITWRISRSRPLIPDSLRLDTQRFRGRTHGGVEYPPDLHLREKELSKIAIDAFNPTELIIGELTWATYTHATLAIKIFNRVQDRQNVVAVDTTPWQTNVIHERDGTDGWLENLLSRSYIGSICRKNVSSTYYIDIPDRSGWAHLYRFPMAAGEPIALTEGERKHRSTEHQLYSVSYYTFQITPLVKEMYSVERPAPLRTVTSNMAVIEKIKENSLPRISYFEMTIQRNST
ncbi:hypothetical protein P175DRAFT_0534177 [Aspergillus ochraceoroseus IBT 24754]|uniref:Dipeptidylpeptidase IV N-terminal domain-containing protein n=2 Tax=Aspergillus ochraceoroseus TaxID=138278 RepID=A0A2T5LTW0_9EURO|nr:uncharacterized protein P175DRAFT_0534177 [Aspergillus ochraceoroseus IBT 24754]KKK15993.1 hypothetical protein AOCH_000962 [Aspergillus ochraceoroseus]PTU19719.1 hypothetical protein P175DRAFT_0534177 [Aspergillus ochraceoroseus IBT 24754]